MIFIFLPFVNSFRTLSQLFGVLEDTFLKCTEVVMDSLIANLHHIVRWPKPSEFEELASEIDKVGLFLVIVIGAIYGLYVEIPLTEERTFEPFFINYKQFHSVDFQVSSVPKNYFCVLVNSCSTNTGY